jgi:hypothetical protein
MAIKISGTTVIDDSRDINNINTLKVGTALTATAGIITTNTIHLTGGNFGPIDGGSDDEIDAALVIDEGQGIYTLESSAGWLIRLLEKQTDVITLGQSNTNKINAIELVPGKNGISKLMAGDGTSTPAGILTANRSGVEVSGILTATTIKGPGTSDATFIGDGSGLSGVTGTGSGVVIRHDNTLVGTAATIDISTNLDVTAVSAGVCTISAAGGGGLNGVIAAMIF